MQLKVILAPLNFDSGLATQYYFASHVSLENGFIRVEDGVESDMFFNSDFYGLSVKLVKE